MGSVATPSDIAAAFGVSTVWRIASRVGGEARCHAARPALPSDAAILSIDVSVCTSVVCFCVTLLWVLHCYLPLSPRNSNSSIQVGGGRPRVQIAPTGGR